MADKLLLAMNRLRYEKLAQILCVILSFVSISTYAANQTLPKIKVVTEYLEPYQVKNPDGSLGGFSTEIVQAIFQQAQYQADISVMPWARAYEVAKRNKNVLIYSIAHTKSRHNHFHWLGSIKNERHYFWGLKTKFPVPIDTLSLLKGYKIAASRNSNVAEYLSTNNFFNVHLLTKEEQNMLMLFKGRVDLISATELTLKKRAERLGLDFNQLIKVSEVTELNNELSIAFSLDTDAKLVEHFQQAFQTIKSQGVIDEIKKKWKI